MDKIKLFLKTSLLGGVVVILPVAILIMFFRWLFHLVTGIIQPLTDFVMETMYISKYQRIFADLMVLGTILITCFIVGIFVKTKMGSYIHNFIENKILKVAPGYSLVRDTVMQFLGGKKAPFSSVAVVRVFGTDVLFFGFITDSHPDGSYTVYIPTAPNPTSGNICHIKGEHVYIVDVPVDHAMRMIISCGAGSTPLIESMMKKLKEKEVCDNDGKKNDSGQANSRLDGAARMT